jgi:hypothetical protein
VAAKLSTGAWQRLAANNKESSLILLKMLQVITLEKPSPPPLHLELTAD